MVCIYLTYRNSKRENLSFWWVLLSAPIFFWWLSGELLTYAAWFSGGFAP